MLRWLFLQKRGIGRGLIAARSTRLKHYAAQSGYHYEYRLEGHCAFRSRADAGTRFVFLFSADRTRWHRISVFLSEPVVRGWEREHARELSSTECYAIAKMSLLQAFDERRGPAAMRGDVSVRAADLEAIVAGLSLD